MMQKPWFVLLIFALLAGCTSRQEPQDPDPERRKSPIAIAKVSHGETYVKIVYGQPYKKGREIFGGLVPYGEVWRTGANEATEITLTRPVLLNDQELGAGTYTLFTIPNPSEWTIVLNSKLGQWGAFDYDSAFDLRRFEVPAQELEKPQEALTIKFDEISGDSTSIIIQWDQTGVRIPLVFISGDGQSAS